MALASAKLTLAMGWGWPDAKPIINKLKISVNL
jgi:hypothetical protein